MKRIATLLVCAALFCSSNLCLADWSTSQTGLDLFSTPGVGNTMLYQDTIATNGLMVERTAWMDDSMVFGRFSVVEGNINPGLSFVNAYLYSTYRDDNPNGAYGSGDDFILHTGPNSVMVTLAGDGTDGIWGTNVYTANYAGDTIKSALIDYSGGGQIFTYYDQVKGIYEYGISKTLLNFDNYTRLSFGGQIWGYDNPRIGFFTDGSSYTPPTTEVPEPATLLLLGCAAAGLPLTRRFRRK